MDQQRRHRLRKPRRTKLQPRTQRIPARKPSGPTKWLRACYHSRAGSSVPLKPKATPTRTTASRVATDSVAHTTRPLNVTFWVQDRALSGKGVSAETFLPLSPMVQRCDYGRAE
jgi:hypothetical protein